LRHRNRGSLLPDATESTLTVVALGKSDPQKQD
jgi:hypothetical protein